jgi:hypothetical protein
MTYHEIAVEQSNRLGVSINDFSTVGDCVRSSSFEKSRSKSENYNGYLDFLRGCDEASIRLFPNRPDFHTKSIPLSPEQFQCVVDWWAEYLGKYL